MFEVVQYFHSLVLGSLPINKWPIIIWSYLFIEELSDEAMVACTIPLEMSGILPEGKHYVREDNDIVISPTGNNKSG